MDTNTWRNHNPGRMTARVLTEDAVTADLPGLKALAKKIAAICPDKPLTFTYRHGHVASAYKWQAYEYSAAVTFGDGCPTIDWSRERTTNNRYVEAGWYFKPSTLEQRRAVRKLLGLDKSARALSIRVL